MVTQEEPLYTRAKTIVQSKGALKEEDGVLTTEPTATVYECIDRMVEHDVGSIVVMEGDDIAGIFTERHYMSSIALEGRSSDETEVQEVMASDIATISPEKRLAECLSLMTELRRRHLLVVNDEDELIGIISIGDCVKQLLDTARSEITQLRDYVTGTYPG